MQTCFGEIRIREGTTRLTASANIFLIDNPALATLFLYLKEGCYRSTTDFESPSIKQVLDDLEFVTQIKWRVDDKFWVLTFEYSHPYIGDFWTAVPKYMETFKRVMGRQTREDSIKLYREATDLEFKIHKLKEQLREDL